MLIAAGHVAAKARLHPGNKRLQYWMDAGDIARLHSRFATPTALHLAIGLHRNTITACWRRRESSRFSPTCGTSGLSFCGRRWPEFRNWRPRPDVPAQKSEEPADSRQIGTNHNVVINHALAKIMTSCTQGSASENARFAPCYTSLVSMVSGGPGRNRTLNLGLRRSLLYPVELRSRVLPICGRFGRYARLRVMKTEFGSSE